MEINVGELPFDLDFHPFNSLVAIGLITGRLHLYRYALDANPERLLKTVAHKKSCRAVRFINGGEVLLTASTDFSLIATDVATGTKIARLKNAHGAAINRLINLTETTVASGDDTGCIKVWDTRINTCCNTFDAHEDYVSDMTFVSSSLQILGTSGDGTLSVCSLRRNKVQTRSEFSEDELLSVLTMKNGRKVVCGTQTGALLLYSWGCFNDFSDRFIGPEVSLDALLKFDEDTLISGSEDGVIRMVGILPNRIIQPLAEHSECPIENLAFSHDRKFLGSISHDQMLKLWDLEEMLDNPRNVPNGHHIMAENDDDGMDVDGDPSSSSKGSRRKTKDNGQSSISASDFFSDL